MMGKRDSLVLLIVMALVTTRAVTSPYFACPAAALSEQPVCDISRVRGGLAYRVAKVEAIMQLVGHPVFVVETYHSPERQKELYQQGRTRPGPMVTWLEEGSAHQEGRAVDLAFKGKDPWGKDHPWEFLGKVGQLLGLKWGGAGDRGHFEL